MALDKRVIAIQMLPAAYDEIQRLKGQDTWTKFIIECVMAKVGKNSILEDELATLLAEAEARKVKEPKAEKPKKAEVPAAETKHEPTEAELKEIEAEGGIGTSTKPKKGKTLQELQAANK